METTLWFGFSLLLRVYQEHASHSPRTYGLLNAVVIFLLWLYLMGASILIGGELFPNKRGLHEEADAAGLFH